MCFVSSAISYEISVSDFPMVASYPHFYTGSPPRDKYVTGLKPDRLKHNSYVMVEPVSIANQWLCRRTSTTDKTVCKTVVNF